jgi:hypothetical protein
MFIDLIICSALFYVFHAIIRGDKTKQRRWFNPSRSVMEAGPCNFNSCAHILGQGKRYLLCHLSSRLEPANCRGGKGNDPLPALYIGSQLPPYFIVHYLIIILHGWEPSNWRPEDPGKVIQFDAKIQWRKDICAELWLHNLMVTGRAEHSEACLCIIPTFQAWGSMSLGWDLGSIRLRSVRVFLYDQLQDNKAEGWEKINIFRHYGLLWGTVF